MTCGNVACVHIKRIAVALLSEDKVAKWEGRYVPGRASSLRLTRLHTSVCSLEGSRRNSQKGDPYRGSIQHGPDKDLVRAHQPRAGADESDAISRVYNSNRNVTGRVSVCSHTFANIKSDRRAAHCPALMGGRLLSFCESSSSPYPIF